jgi:recombination protein RecA
MPALGSLIKMDSSAGLYDPSRTGPPVSTGSLAVDHALGIGGLPRGRVVEIFGPESSGKTSLALSTLAQAQKSGLNCTFIDAEHALDPKWATTLGVQLDKLLVCQPDSGEQALNIADSLIQSGEMHVIVIDSVAALVPKHELEGEVGQTVVGGQARMMSQALRKLTSALNKSNTLLIFINQIRMKIGVMFGNPETTSGGQALKFYASVRLDVRRMGTVKKSNEEAVGTQVKVKVVKNKVAAPFRTAELEIDFKSGISKSGELVDLGLKTGVLTRHGAWYHVAKNDEKLGQGRDKAKKHLEDNPDLASQVYDDIRTTLMSDPLPIEEGEEVLEEESETAAKVE